MTIKVYESAADHNDLFHRCRKSPGVKWSLNWDGERGEKFMRIRCVESQLAGLGITGQQAAVWEERVEPVASPSPP